jgi:hypothetical protein
MPLGINVYTDRLLLAPPELTDYLFENDEDYETALEQNGLLESGLLEWSQGFPDIFFAYIEADCFGGTCVYSGLVCRDKTILERVESSYHAHVSLLRHVDIITRGPFKPFTRVFFEGLCSGMPN